MPPKRRDVKERQRREELERKSREEEELLRLSELAHKEEQERRQLAREERQRQREEEKKKFAEVTDRLDEELEYKWEQLRKWKEEELKKIQWAYFTGNGVPHPSDKRAMNTYLSLCQEDQTSTDIEQVLKDFEDMFKIGEDVEILINGDGVPDPGLEELIKYDQMIQRIRSAMLTRLDRCTMAYINSDPKKYLGPEGNNLLVEGQVAGGRLAYCLWGNVAKDPRYVDVKIEKALEIGFELPRRLVYEDVAVRIMQMNFDFLSRQCHTFKCNYSRSALSTAIGSIPSMSICGWETSGKEGGGSECEQEEGGEGEGITDELSPKQQGEGGSSEDGESNDGDRDVPNTSHTGEDISEKGDRKENGGSEETRSGRVEGEVPKQGRGRDLEADEVDLGMYHLAGNPFLVDLLKMPPEIKVSRNWKIRQVFGEDCVIPYVHPPASVTSLSLSHGSSSSQDLIEFRNVRFPSQYFFSENPIIARWDDVHKIWRTGEIFELEFDMEQRTVSFKTFFFSPFAIMVDRYSNSPYQRWELRAEGLNSTLLTIEGAMTNIAVKIEGSVSTLVGPDNQPHLLQLLHKPTTAKQLINSLEKVGSHFFPEPDAGRFVCVTKKSSSLEWESYKSMALATCGYSFRWSRWNSEASAASVVLAVAGTCEDGEEPTWNNYVDGKRSFKLKLTEDCNTFSLTAEDGTSPHPGLYAALEHDAGPASKEAMKGTSPMHTEAVCVWLAATRPLTFA